jgi:hypothetical protein
MVGCALKQQAPAAEIWFAWAIYTRNWSLLRTCAEHAPPYIAPDFDFLADAAASSGKSFASVEERFDYSKLAAPWNHFHLMWLAVRLNRQDTALLHAKKLCTTTAVGEVRTGRFLNRLLHWPLFDEIRRYILHDLEAARSRLKLTSIETSLSFTKRVEELWRYVLNHQV